jgi:hypothetical protein
MHVVHRVGLLIVGVLVVLGIGSHQPIEAQSSGLGGGFGPVEAPETRPKPAPRVHVYRPCTDKEAAIHRALERPISMPFQSDTPLGDALEYVRQATSQGEGAIEGGVPIYVDEIGLQEAEQSLQSPVRISLEGIPLKTTLRLLLDQLDLGYEVYPDGLIEISAKQHIEQQADPMLLILDELRALRREVEELRREVSASKGKDD